MRRCRHARCSPWRWPCPNTSSTWRCSSPTCWSTPRVSLHEPGPPAPRPEEPPQPVENLVSLPTSYPPLNSSVGPKYVQIHVPCPLGWRHGPEQTFVVAKLAVETGLYPLVEFENGKISGVRQIQPKPVEEYLKAQGRFKHLLNNPEEIKKIQAIADFNIDRYGLRMKVEAPSA